MPKPLPRDPAVRSLLLNEAKAYLDHHVAMLDELEQLYEGMSRVLEAEYSPAGYRDALAGDPVLPIRAERVEELRRRIPLRLNTAGPYLPDFDEEQLRRGAGGRWPNCFRDPEHLPFIAGVEMTRDLIQRLLAEEPDGNGSQPRDGAATAAEEPRKARRRVKKGDARLMLLATLDRLLEDDKLGLTKEELIDKADVSTDTFYRLAKSDGEVQRKLREYDRRSRGRGPARHRDI